MLGKVRQAICAISGLLLLSAPAISAAEKNQSEYSQIKFKLLPRDCPARRLQFPDVDLGVLNLTENRLLGSEVGKALTKSRPLLARGNVYIPPNTFVTYSPNGNFYKNPQFLKGLPENAFDGIVLRFIAMQDDEIGRGDQGLIALSRFKTLRTAVLSRAEITDKGLSSLKACRELELLDLLGCEMQGHFLKELVPCKNLKVLDLQYSSIDKNYFKYLAEYPALATLNLNRSGVNMKALTVLPACKSLTSLDLSSNPEVNDNIVPIALAMPKLKYLDLNKTGVSENGLERLRAKKIFTSKLELYASSPKKIEKMKARRKAKDADAETLFGPVSRGRKL